MRRLIERPLVQRALGRFRSLMHIDGPPWRIALALAIGVFISFTPFYGLQTILAFVVASIARLSVPAIVTGTWLNLPWFAPFIYAGAVKFGALLLPELEGLAGVSTWLLVGTTIFGAVAGILTYVVALGVIRARRARRRAGGPPPDATHRRAA